MMLRAPGGCCPPVFADSFDDATASGFQWTSFGDSATFADDVQRYADENATMYPSVRYPGGEAVEVPIPARQAAKARILFSGEGAGAAQAHLWMGYGIEGGLDQLIAELDGGPLTCGLLRIIQRHEGGISSTVATTSVGPIARDEWHDLTICYLHEESGRISFAAVLTLSDDRSFRLEIEADTFGWDTDPTLNGTGTRQVTSGLGIDFNDFKMLPHKDDATACGCNGCPDCAPRCPEVRETFDRDEIGCCWMVAGTGATPDDWSIVDGELVRDGTDAELLVYTCGDGAPPSFSWQGSVYLPTSGSKARLWAGLENPLTGEYYAAEIEAGETCGKLRMLQGTVGGSDALLGDYVVIPALTPAAFHTLKLSYSRDNHVLFALVNGQHAHHVKNIEPFAAGHLVGIGVGTGDGFKFDELKLSQAQDAGEDDYYDCPERERVCCVGQSISLPLFVNLTRNGEPFNSEVELDEGTHALGYAFIDHSGVATLTCDGDDEPGTATLQYDGPGLFAAFTLTVHSCNPYYATGSLTFGEDVYEAEVSQ